MARKRTKKKHKMSNMILLVLGLFILAFIVTMIWIFCKYGAVPDTLITCTMGAGGIEALLLAAIKISKVVTEKPETKGKDEEA